MFKKIPFFPFLLALYPILTLYARNPGEIPFQTTVRPVVTALIISGTLISIFSIIFKNPYKASIIVSILIFYFSSSGHVYRILKGYLFPAVEQNFHPVLILLEVLLVILIANKCVWDKYIANINHVSATRYANLFSLLILVYPALSLINFGITMADDNTPMLTKAISGNTNQEVALGDPRPDIYIIVLDGYARNDVLREIYAFDNSNFTDALLQRGFYVSENSHSNYMQTPLSFASFLNYSHIDAAT